jgi:hypothetical protein
VLNAEDRAEAGGVGSPSTEVVVAEPATEAKLAGVVSGKGIVARGGGVPARVAPDRSAVVKAAKCSGARPPVRQRT